jgi:hypothetical protein
MVFRFFFPTLWLVWMGSCTSQSAQDSPLLKYFQQSPSTAILHLELPADDEKIPEGDTIQRVLFFQNIGKLMQEVDYIADSTSCTVVGRRRFVLNRTYDACLVEITLSWFKHQSLLIYDKQKHRFTDRVTAAEWYGGEGGQVLTGSWLIDHDGDQQKDLVRRVIEHWVVPTESDEAIEKSKESVELLRWKNGHLVK